MQSIVQTHIYLILRDVKIKMKQAGNCGIKSPNKVQFKLGNYLYCLAGMAAVVGEDGGDGLQDFAGVTPGHHQTEEAGAGQSSDGLSCRVIGPCAPDRGLQQQLEERFWTSTQVVGGLEICKKRNTNARLKKYMKQITIKCSPIQRASQNDSQGARAYLW